MVELKSGAVANFIELAAALFEASYSIERGGETNPERDGRLGLHDVCIIGILGAGHLRFSIDTRGEVIYMFDIFC